MNFVGQHKQSRHDNRKPQDHDRGMYLPYEATWVNSRGRVCWVRKRSKTERRMRMVGETLWNTILWGCGEIVVLSSTFKLSVLWVGKWFRRTPVDGESSRIPPTSILAPSQVKEIKKQENLSSSFYNKWIQYSDSNTLKKWIVIAASHLTKLNFFVIKPNK